MTRRSKLKNKRIVKLIYIVILLVIALICTIISFLAFLGFPHFDEGILNFAKDKQNLEIKEPHEYSATLFMVGDALIHDSVYKDAYQSDGSYDFKPMIEYIKPYALKADLAYYNQETILGGPELGYSNYPRFNSPYEVGDAFIDAGFNLVSLANNHTMDKGETGVINSVNYWKSKDVVTAGQWTSYDERNEAKIYKVNNITYAFFSYTTWTNGLETPSGKEYLNNVYSDDKATADISAVKDLVDVVIVAMHWGNEYSFDVSESQSNIANHLSSLGVDIIIGTHSHVVQPVEYINDGKTLVIYSLGNIISDQVGIERLTGLMMEVTINKYVDVDDNVVISIDNPKAELTYTKSYYSYDRQFKVYPYSMLNDSLLANYMSYYEKYKAVVNSRYSGITWGLTGE